MINSRRLSGSDYWYRQDIRESVTNIVDVLDYVVNSYTYDAYGNTSSTGAFINSFAYTGAVIDAETGLYYMNARYYDPETGRFVSEDSYRGSSEEFWHLYLYCNGDPVNAIDPTGHKATRLCTLRKNGTLDLKKYKNLKENKLYYAHAEGSSLLVTAQTPKCSQSMDIYFYMVPTYCHESHGHKVLTVNIIQINVSARAVLKDNTHIGGNGAYLSSFYISYITINNLSLKIKKDSSTRYMNGDGRFCKWYPGCTIIDDRYAKASTNYKIPYGRTRTVSFGWYAAIDTTETGMGFAFCTGSGTFKVKIKSGSEVSFSSYVS